MRNYFTFHLFLFYFIILLPLDSPIQWKRIGHKIYSYTVLTIQLLHIASQCIYLILNIENYKDIMAILSMCLHGLFRMVYIRWNKRNLLSMLNIINNEFHDKPKELPYSVKSMQQWIKFGCIFTVIFICSNQLTCLQWFVTPVIINTNVLVTSETIVVPFNNSIKTFPTKGWYPFDINVSPWFEIIYFIQCFNIYTFSLLIASVDSFVMYFTLLIHGQFELLKYSLENVIDLAHRSITESNDQNSRQFTVKHEILQRDAYKQLNKYIRQHQLLLKIISQWEKLFNPMVVFVFFNIILVLVFSVFEAVMATTSNALKSVILFELFFMGSWELLIFSLCGEVIEKQQVSIAKSIYFSRWYTCSGEFKQSLRILVSRSYSPILLTIGKLAVLRIASFRQEMSRVFSLFTFLWQMRNTMKCRISQREFQVGSIYANSTSNY